MKARDLTGLKFGRLTAIKKSTKRSFDRPMWLCICVCGNEVELRVGALSTGNTKSCGCLWKDIMQKTHIVHAMTDTRTHRIWRGMKTRCTNKNTKDWKYYGGRGIGVCQRWMDSFEYFLADMGECPKGLTLERKNNDEGYSPNNCIWASRLEQARNKRGSK